jgi:hypothetical protein
MSLLDSAKSEDIDFGSALFLSILAVPVVLLFVFTIGLPFAFAFKFAWNSLLTTWLGLPSATIWHVIALTATVGSLMPSPLPENTPANIKICAGMVAKPLLLVAIILICT